MRKLACSIAMLAFVGTTYADPFAVRNPKPGAPSTMERDPVPAAETPAREVIDHGKARRRAALWTAVGGSALVLGSLTVSKVAAVRYDDALAREDYAEANRMWSVARYYGTGLFAAGAIALGVGAYLYFTAPDKVIRERAAVAPIVSQDSVGFVVSGGF